MQPDPRSPVHASRRLLPFAAAVLACLVATTGVALANGDHPRVGRHGLRGTVGTVAAPTFTVVRAHGPTGTVKTDGQTKYDLTADATVAAAVVGTHVVAKGDRATDGTLSARILAIVPKPVPKPTSTVHPPEGPGAHTPFASGDVTANDGTKVTITDRSGATQAITTTADTKVTRTAAATFADVVAGRKVAVLGARNDDGTFLAGAVHLSTVTHAVRPHPEHGAPTSTSTTPTTVSSNATLKAAAEHTAQAAAPSARAHHPGVVVGTVATVGRATFTITTPAGKTVTVTTSATTKFFLRADAPPVATAGVSALPGLRPVSATFAAVASGLGVMVKGERTGDGTIAADIVALGTLPVPALPVHVGDGGSGHVGDGDSGHPGGLAAVATVHAQSGADAPSDDGHRGGRS